MECALPIPPGHYGTDYNVPYTFSITEEVIQELHWLLSGTFYIRARITTGTGAEFTCLEFVLEMVQEEEQETSTEGEEGDHCQE